MTRLDLVAAFFGPGNEVSVAAAGDIEALRWLESAKEAFLAGKPGVLPRRVGKTLNWYIVADSAHERDYVWRIVGAALGPDLTSAVEACDPNDPFDRTLVSLGEDVVKFETDRDNRERVRDRLALVRGVISARPSLESSVDLPVAELLRSLDLAIVAGDAVLSQQLLDELARRGLLSAQNAAFLKLGRLVALGQYGNAVNLAEWSHLMAIRRPFRVTEDMLRAVYGLEIAPVESEGPAAMLSRFREHVFDAYAALFEAVEGHTSAAALKLFMLRAATEDPQRPELRDRVLELSVALPDADRQLLSSVGGTIPGTEPPPPLGGDARTALREGNYDEALRIARLLAPSLERAELLVQLAMQVDTSAATQEALDALTQLSESERAALDAQVWAAAALRLLRVRIAPFAGGRFPASWLEWMEAVDASPRQDLAVGYARNGSVEWTVDRFLAELDEIVASLTRSRTHTTEDLVRQVAPHLIATAQRAMAFGGQRLAPLLDALVILLVSGDRLGQAEASAIRALASERLKLGINAREYKDLVDALQETWGRIAAPHFIDWGLEVTELLILAHAPLPDARIAFASDVIAWCASRAARLLSYQRRMAELLSNELGLALITPVPFAPAVSRFEPIRGTSVAIHSLDEPASRRAQDLLEAEDIELDVELDSSKVATPRLKQLARKADVFVLVTGSAKHAASDAVHANRPAGAPLLYPGGSGTASIIRVLAEFAENQRAS